MMKQCKPLFTVALIIFFLWPLSAAGSDLEARVRKHVLKNEITVLLLERHLSPTVSFYIRQRAGAVDEISGKTGTAHLLEHMMFKGTTSIGTRNYKKERPILQEIRETGQKLDLLHRQADKADPKSFEALTARLKTLQEEHKRWLIPNELDRIYTENGAEDMNASTGQDVTTYHVSLPSNKIELWARIESDRMRQPVFREFYAERDVIMEERRQRIEANPDGKLSEQFYAAAFLAHPYGRPILGWPSDMRFLNMDDVTTFFQRAHSPRHTVITVVGDIDPEQTLSIIKKYFESLPSQDGQTDFVTEEPPQTGERRVEVVFDAKPKLMVGYHKPPPPAPDDYVFDVIEALLSKGRTSRFYRKLVEKLKIAEYAETSNGLPGARYPNLFVIFAAPHQPHGCSELEKAIDDEIEELKTKPVSEQELQKVKNQMKADYIRYLQSNQGLASMISYYEVLLGDYRYLTGHLGMIDKISPVDIMQAAQKYLKKDNRTLATLTTVRNVQEQPVQSSPPDTEK